MSASEITLDDLEAWGHDTIAENFVELSEEVAEFDESLRAPLLFGAKGIMVFGKVGATRNFSPDILATFRQGCSWMIYCKGKIGEAVSRREHKLKVLKAGLVDDVMKDIARKGIRISDAKIETQISKNEKVQAMEGQLSVLNGIFAHVMDHCFQYKLLKDIIIQESANVRQMMKDGAHEEREMNRYG